MIENFVKIRAASVGRFLASRVIVTPFLPFILSGHFLSDEVYKHGVRLLNLSSIDLSKTRDSLPESLRVVYCETKLLPLFREVFLPRLPGSFVLITGSLHLPDLDPQFARQMLPELEQKSVVWFSHNPPFENEQPWGFPFGVPYPTSHLALLWAAKSRLRKHRLPELLVPFCRIHDHLPDDARVERMGLRAHMQSEKNVNAYLKSLGMHNLVLSPRGDRPDTFRHWESLLLGSYPVTTLPPQYEKIFANSMITTENLSSFAESPPADIPLGPAPITPALVHFWRKRMASVLEHLHEELT